MIGKHPYHIEKRLLYFFSLFASLFSLQQVSIAQKTVVLDSSAPYLRKIIAGSEYNRSENHRRLWGENYRKEWTTPVTFPVLNLDSAFGGITPLKEGGKQTKSLRVKDAQGRQYVLRMVNKTYLGTIPKIVAGSFVGKLANDQVSTLHPYAALTVPLLSMAAGVYYTQPRYYFVPQHPKLGEYNEVFGNSLCLFEERPDSTQIRQSNFGNPDDIIGTEEMMQQILEKSTNQIDQHAYMKARLFDMFLGDWGRHKENWRWSVFNKEGKTIYKPIPRDRDQTFAKFEGSMLNFILRMGKYKELQSFDDDVQNLKWYNYPAFGIDKRFTNELELQSWIDTARSLQQHLTDRVIEQAVRQMPPEIFEISGNEIIRKLKSRRNKLAQWATEYYSFLSEDVEIPGTKETEVFEVTRINDQETEVKVFALDARGVKHTRPYYARKFLRNETEEVKLYGIDGNDVFKITGRVKKGIEVKVVGGPGNDSLIDQSAVGGWSKQTKYFDNKKGNTILNNGETRTDLDDDTSVNRYQYEVFHFDSRGVRPILYFNSFYRFYAGASYSFTTDKARGEKGFKQRHTIGINYSLVEKSIHPYYQSIFNDAVGKWDLHLNLGYDEVRRFNYFGAGNETRPERTTIEYYWMKLKTAYASAGLQKLIDRYHTLRFEVLYNGVQVIDNQGGFNSVKEGKLESSVFGWKHFAGPQITYDYVRTNDLVIPTKGIIARATASYTNNINTGNRAVTKGGGAISFYIPLVKTFSLAIKNGASVMWGQPEFYQLNNIGGFYSLRGFWRFRFYGTSTAYNQNELRWLAPWKKINGRIGLLTFFDQGRVWQKGESSDKWHYGYGGGLILVPFNRIAITVTQSWSEEGRRTNIRLGRLF